MATGPLSIKLRCASWQQLATIYKRDLSRGSMFLKAGSPPPIGTQVRIDLTLPSASVIVLTGVVMEHVTDPQRGAGVELKLAPIPASSVWMIESALASEVKRRDTPAAGVPIVSASPPTGPNPALGGEDDVSSAEQELIKALLSEAESLRKLNPFLVLGVGYEANDTDVRAAFGELTKRYHPDLFARYESTELRKVAAEIFILIRDAYRKLGDDASRAQALAALGRQPAAPRAVRAGTPPPVPMSPPPVPVKRAPTVQVPVVQPPSASPPPPPPPVPASSATPPPPPPTRPIPRAITDATPTARPGETPPPLTAAVPPPRPPKPPEVPKAITDATPTARPGETPPPLTAAVPPMRSQPINTVPMPSSQTPSKGMARIGPEPINRTPADHQVSRSTPSHGVHRVPAESINRNTPSHGVPRMAAPNRPATVPPKPPDHESNPLEDLMDEGKFDEAIMAYKMAAKKNPNDRSARAGVEVAEGLRSMAQRDRLEAAQRFEAALEIDPSNERAARELADMRRQATNERKGLLTRLMGKKE